jgi:hypothetical protein
MAGGDLRQAWEAGRLVLAIARACNLPPLRYSAHLLLGRIAEARGSLARAAQRYRAAAATVDRVQRSLTITLRPGFLENKGEALRSLIGLQLRSGHVAQAFASLEQAKSQVLLSYLANRQQFRWAAADAQSQALIDELNRLREEHQWFYTLAHEPAGGEEGKTTIAPERAMAEVSTRERRMRAITEQLYLRSPEERGRRLSTPSLQAIQGAIGDGELLIEFYNDGSRVWAFTLDAGSLEVRQLPTSVAALDQLGAQLGLNLSSALRFGAPTPPSLAVLGDRLLQRLYAALLAPLAERMAGRRRLLIVPYGGLHALPFHLLHSGEGYLIDSYEVVNLPAAGLALHRAEQRAGGARVLAHSLQGRLPHVGAEAEAVRRLFGGSVYHDAGATRAALQAPPTQILHIAAHGEHRLDQPDLSCIHLADGQIYTDDLLQQDLSYELVTLSACETGRASVAPGDELIGLGRGFLYAGAGALIVSLWRVPDESTAALMEHLYAGLRSGASKAAALRAAQLALRAAQPRLHPAFWGAFQLVGDARPLSREA